MKKILCYVATLVYIMSILLNATIKVNAITNAPIALNSNVTNNISNQNLNFQNEGLTIESLNSQDESSESINSFNSNNIFVKPKELLTGKTLIITNPTDAILKIYTKDDITSEFLNLFGYMILNSNNSIKTVAASNSLDIYILPGEILKISLLEGSRGLVYIDHEFNAKVETLAEPLFKSYTVPKGKTYTIKNLDNYNNRFITSNDYLTTKIPVDVFTNDNGSNITYCDYALSNFTLKSSQEYKITSYSSDFKIYAPYNSKINFTLSNTIAFNKTLIKPNETYSFKNNLQTIGALGLDCSNVTTDRPNFNYCVYTNDNNIKTLGSSTSFNISSLDGGSYTKITNTNSYNIYVTWLNNYNFTATKASTPAILSIDLNDTQSLYLPNTVQASSPIKTKQSSKIDVSAFISNQRYKLFPDYDPSYNNIYLGKDTTIYISPIKGDTLTVFLPSEYKNFYKILNTPAIQNYTLNKNYYLEINNPEKLNIYAKFIGENINLDYVLTYDTNTNTNSTYTKTANNTTSSNEFNIYANNTKLASNSDSPTQVLLPGILSNNIKLLPGTIVKHVLLAPKEVLHITNMSDYTLAPTIKALSIGNFDVITMTNDVNGNMSHFYKYSYASSNSYSYLTHITPKYNDLIKNVNEKLTLEILLPIEYSTNAYVNNDELVREIDLKAGTTFKFKNINREGILLSNVENLGINLNYNSSQTNSNVLQLEPNVNYVIKGDATKDIKLYLPTKILDPSSNNILDVNYDNIVDIYDLSTVSSKYNVNSKSANYSIKCDFNKDYIIDIYDLVYISKRIF